MTLDDLERQNKGFYGFFFVISGCTSLYHSQGGATVANAIGTYGRCVLWSWWAESKWYVIFKTITTELEMLYAFARLVSFAQISWYIFLDNTNYGASKIKYAKQ